MRDSINREQLYAKAQKLAVAERVREAHELYMQLVESTDDQGLLGLVENDLGVLAALSGNHVGAREWLRKASRRRIPGGVAKDNLRLLQNADADGISSGRDVYSESHPEKSRAIRVAIVSLLFNWPSRGGGIIHTAELGQFLAQAGYEARHFYAEFSEWDVGRVTNCPSPCQPIKFDPGQWSAPEIQRRFRRAVDDFAADVVIITDSWSFKPLLAEAMQGYRYLLRIAALECLCPLNNVRLLVQPDGTVQKCPRHQLATPRACLQCVGAQEQFSGDLHRLERSLSGFGSRAYLDRLYWAFANAEAVLVVNPLVAEMVKPHARAVRLVPSGFDAARFPRTADAEGGGGGSKPRLLFAGLVPEFMKGFHVVREACRKLWAKRQDFELIVTDEGGEPCDEFTRFVGWLSQEELAQELQRADCLVFPTLAEEALGRTAVEAMAASRAVIASRIGGLQFTVIDGFTGLLFEPGCATDLAEKIERLLDCPELRREMGRNGREVFEREYAWERVIERHYRPLLGVPLHSC